MSKEARPTLLARLVKGTTRIEGHEFGAAVLSFIFVFILMAAYFILRPVRDAMASDWSDAEVSFLWTLTFFFSVVAVGAYGTATSRVRFRWLVPGVYGFFAASFVLFYVASTTVPDPTLSDKSFYVWLSVFSLFHVSVFWSFMSDVWSKEQAPRLFGFIAAGSSLGAIVGPLIAAALADVVGTKSLLLLSAGMLFLPVPVIFTLERLKTTTLGNAGVQADLSRQANVLGDAIRGFELFLKSRFLIGIGAFILLYVAIGSFVYFDLKNLLAPYTRAERTEIYALIDFAVNTLTFVIAFFVTSRLATRFGMPTTLSLVPFLIAIGMFVIAMSPVIAVVAGLQIARRAGNYAITRPGREMLFTTVDRESRFKAKPVVDIVLYRGGDMLWAWVFTLLTTGLGLGLAAVSAIGGVIAVIWGGVGIWLGRQYRGRDEIAVLDEVAGKKVAAATGESAPQ